MSRGQKLSQMSNLEEETWPLKNGASEGIRTLDTHVGNVMLYQAELRSLPAGIQVMRISAECKTGFRIIFH